MLMTYSWFVVFSTFLQMKSESMSRQNVERHDDVELLALILEPRVVAPPENRISDQQENRNSDQPENLISDQQETGSESSLKVKEVHLQTMK